MRHALLAGLAFLFAPLAAAQPPAVQAPPVHPGETVYKRACASCHDTPTGRTPTLAHIKSLSGSRLGEILFTGVMGPIGSQMPQMDIGMLIAWLTAGQPPEPVNWADAIACPAAKRTVDTSRPATTIGFSGDRSGTRALTAKQAGLTKSQMKDLEPAWAIAYPAGMGGNGNGGTILGDTVFISLGGRMLALDAASGCAKWVYGEGTRNTPTIGEIAGRKVIAFNSGRDIHVLDAATGALVWKASAQPARGQGGSIRSGVVFVKDKIIVPISASGVAAGGDAKIECCDGHGAVVALSAADGKRLWEWHTMPEATYNGQVNSIGVKQRGPSGAPIWSFPLVDEKRNQLVFTSGEDTSHPTTKFSDAVIALDIDTGELLWSYQALAGDVWNMACDVTTGVNGPNCPLHFGGEGKDLDFGAGAIIAKSRSGDDLIIAGQKSGHVYAFEAKSGTLVWSKQVGTGSVLGGIHWGLGLTGKNVIVAINDPLLNPNEKYVSKAGLYALDASSGKQRWAMPLKPNCDNGRDAKVSQCTTRFGLSAAPMIADQTILAGSLGGELLVIDGANGKLIKRIDTTGPRTTINPEIAGAGGSIDSHGVFAGAGMVFVNSGYGQFGQTPGNVFLAYKPKAK